MVYYDELDGQLYPKWLLLKPSKDDITYYSIDSPYERIYDLGDLRLITLELADLLRNDNNNDLGINLIHIEKRLTGTSFHRSHIDEIDYFILLVDDVQEIMEYTLK
ncbi:hypothetical protein [Bacillus sp. 03113]|uniref:hypothetical protein n=1 Tax=Bacillus sp. 03113 TaxID=2578211 RepID=UPI00114249A0|nr:hypothetical protein [Bacillus sp. 03113]